MSGCVKFSAVTSFRADLKDFKMCAHFANFSCGFIVELQGVRRSAHMLSQPAYSFKTQVQRIIWYLYSTHPFHCSCTECMCVMRHAEGMRTLKFASCLLFAF